MTAAFLLIFLNLPVASQIMDPVDWEFEKEQIEANEYELRMTAIIDPGWYIYGMELEPGGPIPTDFIFEENDAYELVGDISAPEAEVKYDPNFEMDIPMYSGQVTFTQVERKGQKIRGQTPLVITRHVLQFPAYGHRISGQHPDHLGERDLPAIHGDVHLKIGIILHLGFGR